MILGLPWWELLALVWFLAALAAVIHAILDSDEEDAP